MLKQWFKSGLCRYAQQWPPGSRLFTVTDIDSWVINWEMRVLRQVARRLGIRLAHRFLQPFSSKQAVFYGSQFFLLSDENLLGPHRIATAYFHGKPGCGILDFDRLYARLCKYHQQISRVQVSHSEMHAIVLASGIAPEKVFRIPIGIQLDYFDLQCPSSKTLVRKRLGIPQSAVVIGSFQKDGTGWQQGLEPKWIKGPDLFLQVIQRLSKKIPELFVLLSGPARGYVQNGLRQLGVPFRHRYLKHYPQIGELYHALDLYLVTSRQEGGPKAVLESMACGIPLVTTRVGQAMDLVQHGINGYLLDVDDLEGLTHYCERVVTHPSENESLRVAARHTAEENAYARQLPLWRRFMHDFVTMDA